MPFAHVALPYDLAAEAAGPLGLVSALAGSASTLTALYGLTAEELGDSRQRGLAAFAQLRDLTLLQTELSPVALSAALLPASLEELDIAFADPAETGGPEAPPLLAAFETLCSLRRVTFTCFAHWVLGSSCADGTSPGQLQLPPGLEVC